MYFKRTNKQSTCIISGASGPHIDAPSTLSVSASTTNFITIFSCRLEAEEEKFMDCKEQKVLIVHTRIEQY